MRFVDCLQATASGLKSRATAKISAGHGKLHVEIASFVLPMDKERSRGSGLLQRSACAMLWEERKRLKWRSLLGFAGAAGRLLWPRLALAKNGEK